MDLVADFFARLQAHHHELTILAGEQDLTKIPVFQGLFLDWSKITAHGFLSPFTGK
jgi:hypothetical protein